MIRRFFVWLHRWVGLLMTAFLIVVGLTGSILAFKTPLEKVINPELFGSPPSPEAPPLDLATLAERAETLNPHVQVTYFSVDAGQAIVHVLPRMDPSTGKPFGDVSFDQLFLDPWTGRELGHRMSGNLSQGRINVIPFIFKIHMNLAMGDIGTWILGIVALAWTLDCIYAIYLTFPLGWSRFLLRWLPAWKVKWRASAFRLNFDAHRASGLWFAPLLFIFAWSSVMFNLTPVYERVMGALFQFTPLEEEMKTLHPPHPTPFPRLDWRAGLVRSQQLMEDLARKEGFKVFRPFGFAYINEPGVYSYSVESSRDIAEGSWDGVGIWVDGETGELQKVFLPTGERAGDSISHWLRTLHFANLHGWLAYRVLVCILGIIITVLSVTGVYIWWKKLRARRINTARRVTALRGSS